MADMADIANNDTKTRYIIQPTYKKSVVEEQYWSNTISNGKTVKVKANNVYRWGEFYIDLTDEEKEDILEREMIELCDYEHELMSCWDGGCDFWVDIIDEEDFSKEEIDEIHKLVYHWKEGEGELSQEDGDGGEGSPLEDVGYSYEKMEENGWCEMDCEFVITSTCELNKVMEDECHE